MENKKPSLFSQIRPYLKGFQLPLALAFVGAVLSNIITVYGPNKLKEITNLISDGLATSIDLKAVSQIALLLTVLYAVGASTMVSPLSSVRLSSISPSGCGRPLQRR